MTLIITKLDGTTYNLEQLGIRVMEFEPESLTVRNEVIELDGSAVITHGLGYGARNINATFKISGTDLQDYAAFRSEVFDLFVSTERFYITDQKEPFKRWDVRSNGNFSLSRAIKAGTFDITFLCVNIFAESVFTTAEIENTKFWDNDIWTWGSGIDWDSELKYSQNTNNFAIYNGGNAEIDGRRNELLITIQGIASSFVQLTNNTTGDIYRYNGSLNNLETLTINGVKSNKNNVSVVANTNFGVIKLAPGENRISITGLTNNNINFDFRYLYK